MTAETIKEVIKSRDRALARVSEQDGFRRYWKDRADTMLRKFDAAQAHAWEMEQGAANLESMLSHASDTIGRLEGRWRSPGAAKEGVRALVIEQGTLFHHVATLQRDGHWWSRGEKMNILAWCELPAIPADEMYKDLA